jgi:hypothetical protein
MMARQKLSWTLPDAEYWPALANSVMARTKPNDRGCLEFQGFRVPNKGYGQIGVKPRAGRSSANEHTHRVAYRGLRGPIPEGWDVCHTCDNPPCCNPLHLFAAPRVANLIDMRNKGRNRQTQKTHCPKGHSYAEHGGVKAGQPTWRVCKQCERERFASPGYKAWARGYRKERRAKLKAERCGMGKPE